MTKKLLVADDSVTIQRVVALTFAGEDVQIEVAADGDKALAMVRDGKHDVVLADVLMPGLTGYKVCEQIKSDPNLSHIPVVLLVGTFEPFDRAEANRVKSDGYLTKPFDTSELIQTYKSLVNRTVVELEKPGVWHRSSDQESNSVTAGNPLFAGEILVSPRTRESFLGEEHILEILPLKQQNSDSSARSTRSGQSWGLPTDAIRGIIEGIVRQISPEIVREVAWEVVPEMSEMMIRTSLDQAGPAER